MSHPSDVPATSDRHAADQAAKLAAWHIWRDRIYRGYAIGVGLAIVAAFLESFHNLIAWFQSVGMRGFYGWIAPAMIDVFILGGEALLLVAVMEKWDWKPKLAAWVSIVLGLAGSIAGNLGAADLPVTPHGAGAAAAIAALKTTAQHLPLKQMISFAVAPVALAGLSALGLMIVKRALRTDGLSGVSGVSDVPQDALVALTLWPEHARAGTLPPVREIIKKLGCGQPRAVRIRAYLTDLHEAFVAAEDGAGEDERVTR